MADHRRRRDHDRPHPGGRKWVVSYDYPSGGSISQTMSVLTGRSKARDWKKALAEAGA